MSRKMNLPTSRAKSITRRGFIGNLLYSSVALGSITSLANKIFASDIKESIRRFHICLQPQAIKDYPELPSLIRESGVTDIWLAGFLYGRWYHTPDELEVEANRLRREGFRIHIINVPLGHPGASIGLEEGHDLNTPPAHWKNGCSVDGKRYSGTSIHAPAQKENIQAVREISEKKFDAVFLDDDFRLARSPGQIGGCFCDDCQKEFLDLYGFQKSDWTLLLDSVTNRNPTFILRQWTDYSCNKLYDMFAKLQAASPEISLGIMVMFLGSEKAGIPLDRFRQVPCRVGELMFDDKSFQRVKGKTDELFSSLFHRRFAQPDLAYSESTAYPADRLSARNMAAKLNVSLISDVRHTMFMSGLLPFPVTHWHTLGPAMKKSAEFHEVIAGHKTRGPFKHFWGWDSRLVGKDNPFSLFLALGIPFEVVEELPADGWVFLSDEDARAVSEGRLKPVAGNLIARPENKSDSNHFIFVGENLDALFAFKKKIRQELKGIPYVEEDIPVVLSWYPTARAALIWNLTEQKHDFTIKCDDQIISRNSLAALEVELITNLQV
jgi:hypothetical protein